MTIKATCPACGTEGDLVLWIEHAGARAALLDVLTGGLGHAKRVVQYVGLFAPAKRRLGLERAAKLLAEVAALYRTGQFSFDGRSWPGPESTASLDRESIDMAIDKMLEQRAAGKLVPPLQNHHYLFRILVAQVQQFEGRAERNSEADRRERARSGAPVASTAAHALAGVNIDRGFTSQAEMAAEAKRRRAAAGQKLRPEVSDDSI